MINKSTKDRKILQIYNNFGLPLSCLIFSVLYFFCGYFKNLEYSMIICSCIFIIVLPKQQGFCFFAFLHLFTLSNNYYESNFFRLLIVFTIKLIVICFIGVKNKRYVEKKNIVVFIVIFLIFTTLISIIRAKSILSFFNKLLPTIHEISILFYFPLAYCVFLMKDDFSIDEIMKYLLYGVIVSTSLAFFSLLLKGYKYKPFDNSRLRGFTNNSTHYCIKLLFLLMFYTSRLLEKKFLFSKYIFIYGLITTLTLLTLSKRGFIVLIIVSLLLCVNYLINNKKKLYFLLMIVLAIIIFSCKTLSLLLNRFKESITQENLINKIFSGRIDIWKSYIKFMTKDIWLFLFGRGIFATNIYVPEFQRRVSPHSLFLAVFYKFGIVGFALIITLTICLVKKNLNKNYISMFPLFYILLECLVDNMYTSYNFSLIILAFLINLNSSKNKTDNQTLILTKETIINSTN